MRKAILFLIASFLLSAAALMAQPKIEIVGGATHDWQTVSSKDSPLKAKISIRNSGDEILRITDVKPTCGCTTAPLDKDSLAPGEEATLDVSLRIGSRSGKVHKSIRVMSNDPKNKMEIIHLKALVRNPVDITPMSYFAFNEMEVGSESESKLKITNNSKKTLKITDIKTNPKALMINLKGEKTLKPGESYTMIARATPDKEGYFRGTVKFHTSHPDYKNMTINAYGRVIESPIYNNK
jgi:hypothetical protein